MPAPTLGCQIAPDYDDVSSSDSDSDSTNSEEGERVESSERTRTASELNIEKAETQREVGEMPQPVRPSTLQRGRTRSSRKEQQTLEPVGFWHWQMVRSRDV